MTLVFLYIVAAIQVLSVASVMILHKKKKEMVSDE